MLRWWNALHRTIPVTLQNAIPVKASPPNAVAPRTGRAVDAPSPQTALQRRHLPKHRSLPRVSEISLKIYRKQISRFVVCNRQLSPQFTADLGRSRMQSAACFIVFKRLFLLAFIRSSPE